MTDRKLMQQALEALKLIDDAMPFPVAKLAIKNLSERLAQPEQEPMAVVKLMETGGNAGLATVIHEIDNPVRERLRPGDKLYTAPQPRQWQGLTDEEVEALWCEHEDSEMGWKWALTRAIEAHLKEKHMTENYTNEEDTAELMRVSKLPTPLRLAAMLEKTMQWPLHGKSADCLREMYELLLRCEQEMRHAGWDKREADNPVKNDVYEQVKSLLG